MQDSTQLAGDAWQGRPRSTFSSGTILADRFRIVRAIGRGGMGEVYEADDFVSNERVALKTIKADAFTKPQFKVRFKKELQLSRQVSHPNVCRVFELWETTIDDGQPLAFFTMELLKGETLAQRIATRGPLNYREALPLIKQVAAGLEEVHRLGIIHRDLKPGNIFLVDDAERGTRAVVMDFGLARNTESLQAETGLGVVMGTPAYMAPEQFSSAQVTVAADIYSFGVTVFEMVTGRHQPLVAPSSIVTDIPREWDAVLLRCFDVKPANRPASIADAVAALEITTGIRKPAAIGVGVMIALFAIGIALWRTLPTAVKPRAPVVTKLTFDQGHTTDPAASADGKLLVYASDRNSNGDLNIWLQRLDTGETQQLTDDPGNDVEPAISPNGQAVAFHSERDGRIYIKPIFGGGETKVLAELGQNPQFSPDGSWVAYWTGQRGELSNGSARLWIVPASGGTPKRLAPDFADARYPAWSADSRHVLFRGESSDKPSLEENSDWWIVDISTGAITATGAWKRFREAGLTLPAYRVQWDGDRVLFSGRSGHSTNLWSIALPQSTMRVTQAPQSLTAGAEFEVEPAALADGRIIYANLRTNTNIWKINLQSGNIDQVTKEDSTDSKVSASQDGRTLVFGRRLGEVRNVWSMDLASNVSRQLIANEDAVPFVSPNGADVAYSVDSTVYVKKIQTGLQSALCTDCGELVGWKPDGTAVLFLRKEGTGTQVIGSIDVVTRNQSRLLSGRDLHEMAMSPDSKFLAFTGRQDGTFSRIYLKRFDSNDSQEVGIPITPADTWSDKPVWSENGKRIFYSSERDGFRCIWVQDVDTTKLTGIGDAKAVYHFHSAGFSPSYLSRTAFSLALARNSMFLNVTTIQGNIWAVRP